MDLKLPLRQRTQVTHMSFPGKDSNPSSRKRVAGELDVLTIEGRDLTPFGRKHVQNRMPTCRHQRKVAKIALRCATRGQKQG